MVVTLTAFGAQSRPLRQDHLKQWSGRDITQLVGMTSDSLAVVAVLIATVAFSAAFNVAGGYGDDGKAVLQEKPCYAFFIVFDSIALTASVVGVILLVYGKASGSWKSFVFSLHCIWVSLISMIVAFCASLVAVTRRTAIFRSNSVTFQFISTAIFALGLVIVHWIFKTASFNTIVKFLWRSSLPGRQHVIERRRVTRQYPFAGAYSRNLLMFVAINTIGYFGALIAVMYISCRPSTPS